MVNHIVAVHSGHMVLSNSAWQCDPRAPLSENTPRPPLPSSLETFPHSLTVQVMCSIICSAGTILSMPYNSLTSETRINGMSKQRRLLTPVFVKIDKYCPCTEDVLRGYVKHTILYTLQRLDSISTLPPWLLLTFSAPSFTHPTLCLYILLHHLCPDSGLLSFAITTQNYNYYWQENVILGNYFRNIHLFQMMPV